MEIVRFVLGLLPGFVLALAAWRLLRRPPAESFAGRMLQCTGLVALAGLVASLVQLVVVFASDFSAVLLLTLPLAWWVLAGGWTVQQVFEETAKSVTGHRQSTFMDDGHYYLALMAVQTLLVAAIVAWRRRESFARDPRAVFVLVLALANSLAGITWTWWGT